MNEVLIFVSDLAGRHSSGDARTALRQHGAVHAHAGGMQGRSYAIPVRDACAQKVVAGGAEA